MKKLIATLFAALISGAAFADFDNATLADYTLGISQSDTGVTVLHHGERSGNVYQDLDVQ